MIGFKWLAALGTSLPSQRAALGTDGQLMVVSAAGELARVGVLARAIPPPGPTSLYDWEVARAAVAAAHALAVEPLCQSAAPPDYACAAEGEHGSGRLRGSFFFQVLPCKHSPGLRWGCLVAHLCEVAIQTLDEACVLSRRKCNLCASQPLRR